MKWIEQSKGFWRSADGRFDIIEVRDGEVVDGIHLGTYVVAIDWDFGNKSRHPTMLSAQVWCKMKSEVEIGPTFLITSRS